MNRRSVFVLRGAVIKMSDKAELLSVDRGDSQKWGGNGNASRHVGNKESDKTL